MGLIVVKRPIYVVISLQCVWRMCVCVCLYWRAYTTEVLLLTSPNTPNNLGQCVQSEDNVRYSLFVAAWRSGSVVGLDQRG